MEVVIEGTTVRNERDVHQQLADQIDFGPHYGWNLAALWDRLSADVPRPLLIIWRHADQSRRTLGAESFADLVGVLARAAGQDAEAGLVDRLVLRLEQVPVGVTGEGKYPGGAVPALFTVAMRHDQIMPDDVILTDPWVDLRCGGPEDERERTRLHDEIMAEVIQGHPLHAARFEVLGRSYARDDVLIRLADKRWAIVHVTWSKPERPPWPATEFFDTARAVERAIDLAN